MPKGQLVPCEHAPKGCSECRRIRRNIREKERRATNPEYAAKAKIWNRNCYLRHIQKTGTHRKASRSPEEQRERQYGMVWPPGVTVASLWAAQKGLCWCCRVNLSTLPPTHWGVDHDHETGLVQGLLCRLCNSGAGHLKDSSYLAARTAVYRSKSHVDFSWFPGNLTKPDHATLEVPPSRSARP